MRLPSRPASFFVCTATHTSLPVVGCFSSRWLPFPGPPPSLTRLSGSPSDTALGKGRACQPEPRAERASGEGWCRGWESNPHDPFGSQDFKSCASASFATPAYCSVNNLLRRRLANSVPGTSRGPRTDQERGLSRIGRRDSPTTLFLTRGGRRDGDARARVAGAVTHDQPAASAGGVSHKVPRVYGLRCRWRRRSGGGPFPAAPLVAVRQGLWSLQEPFRRRRTVPVSRFSWLLLAGIWLGLVVDAGLSGYRRRPSRAPNRDEPAGAATSTNRKRRGASSPHKLVTASSN